MTRRLRNESGFALMGSMMILIILMGLALFTIARSDTQQKVSATERVKESGFNLAEAALNAQALQLGRNWPTSASPTQTCDPSTSSSAWCPQASALANAYNGKDYSRSCGTSTNPIWKTTVHDNVSGQPQYWTTGVNSTATFDQNGDGSVWIRSYATIQCRPTSIVGLVTATSMPITIASSVVTANWLATSNQGRKVIIDTLGAYAQPKSIQPGPAAQPAKVSLRCSAPVGTSPCANYASGKGQIQPPAVQTSTGTSPQALSASQLQALEQQAAAAGTLHSGSTDCPNTPALLSSPSNGAPVVIQGPCNISVTGNGQINTSAAPGVLVIENGTLTLGGTINFFGLIYMVNKQLSSGSVVTIGGNATVQGAVNIDGLGGITAGSSKTNLIWDARATGLLKGSTGASINRGTVRVLPPSTP
jgi:Tfp pilus assembly protein PilX